MKAYSFSCVVLPDSRGLGGLELDIVQVCYPIRVMGFLPCQLFLLIVLFFYGLL